MGKEGAQVHSSSGPDSRDANPGREKKIKDSAGPTVYESFLAGAFSGIVARSTISPLDVLKIRFQLQVESISRKVSDPRAANAKYRGVTQAVRTIVAEEGIKGLWKGNVVGSVMYMCYGAAQFSTYNLYKKQTAAFLQNHGYEDSKVGVFTHFFGGGFSGCFATVITYPLDTVRTRLVSQGEPKTYLNSRDAIKKIYVNEGALSFYKGLLPTLCQIFPYMGFQFGFYEAFKWAWLNGIAKFEYQLYRAEAAKSMEEEEERKTHLSATGNFFCGGASGIFAKLAVMPMDTIKKRMQVQGFEEARKHFGKVVRYSGATDCAIQMLRLEGIASFYKGGFPSMLKAAPASAVTFLSYGLFCDLLKAHR
eukprot:Nk52_evm10s243 gene=Nk52_evmTU10s243